MFEMRVEPAGVESPMFVDLRFSLEARPRRGGENAEKTLTVRGPLPFCMYEEQYEEELGAALCLPSVECRTLQRD
jgi:hypothetical protein